MEHEGRAAEEGRWKRQRQTESTEEFVKKIIDSLDERYTQKCCAAEMFPPKISVDIKRDCIRRFQEALLEKKLPIRACAVCGG